MGSADKCPNCGAFLPVKRWGQPVRSCNFCGIEVKGDTAGFPAQPSTGAAQVADASRAVRSILLAATVAILTVVGVVAAVKKTTTTTTTTTTTQAVVQSQAEEKRTAELVRQAGGYADFDAIAFLPTALAAARELAPDVVLTMMVMPHVRPDGRADLTLSDDQAVAYEFRSVARSRPPAGTPIGARVSLECRMFLSVMPGVTRSVPMFAGGDPHACRKQAVRPPSCSAADVWKMAIADGAPREAVALLIYEAADELRPSTSLANEPPPPGADVPARGEWRFGIGDVSFHKRYADNCGVPPAELVETPDGRKLDRRSPSGRAELTRQGVNASPAVRACYEEQRKQVKSRQLLLHFEVAMTIAAGGGLEAVAVEATAFASGTPDQPIQEGFAACADKVLRGSVWPPGDAELRVQLRGSIDEKETKLDLSR